MTATAGAGWFSAAGTARRALLPIAELLFQQMVDLSSTCMAMRPGLSRLERQSERIWATQLLLRTLEEFAGLGFARPGVPYLSNTHRWGDGVAAAGVTGDGPDPAPSTVVFTLNSGLFSHAGSEYPDIRATRAIEAFGTAPESVDFLVTVVDHGLVPASVAGRVLGTTWGTGDSTILGRLVALAFEQFDRVRAAENFDEWLFGQVVMNHRCAMAIRYSRVDDPPTSDTAVRWPLGVRAALSQLEEIRADTGVLEGTIDGLVTDGAVSARQILKKFGSYLELVTRMDHHGRIGAQRLGLPAALDLAALDRPDLPAAWADLSTRAAAVLVPLYAPVLDAVAHGDVAPATVADAARAAHQAVADGRFADGIALSEVVLAGYPWFAGLRLEKAIALDLNGQPDDALTLLVESIALAPTDHLLWHSLSVVLTRCGAPEESRLAWAMKLYLEKVDSDPDKPWTPLTAEQRVAALEAKAADARRARADLLAGPDDRRRPAQPADPADD